MSEMRIPTTRCRKCPEQIAWVKTPAGASMPIDPTPNDRGNVIVRFEAGVLVGQVLLRSDPTRPQGVAFMPHWATCMGLPENVKRAGKPRPEPKPEPVAPPSLF